MAKKVSSETEIAKFHMNTRKPVVLLAPLDWGLGHTIRCVPIIQELLRQGCEVLVACNSKQKLILTEEFSSISFVDLQGYDVYYGNSRLKTLFNIFLQGPKILTRINREKSWLKTFLLKNRVNAVISDNRYGFFSARIPCIFITHQLKVKSGMGFFMDGLIQKFVYHYINKFTVCWIPDWKNPVVNVGGDLSHPEEYPRSPIKYIGCLSRFKKCVQISKTNDLLIILSGPEPQRSILEYVFLQQLKGYGGIATLIRGVFDNSPIASFNKITVLNYTSANELNRIMCTSEIVISRAGYTSIMDILKLGKKSILIPTPGQAEQQYLASYMHKKKLACAINQENFCLETALETALQFHIESVEEPMDKYKKAIEELVTTLK